jgi:uncharacterized protein
VTVYADTSALFAAIARNDRHHEEARASLSACLEEDRAVVTTSYVVLETLALLQARVGMDAAHAFERAVRPLLEVIWVDEDLHERAFRRLELRASRRVSLVDCAGFVVMEERGIDHALAFDQHFAEEGFRRP